MSTAKFAGLQGLAGLARHEGIDAKPTLLRVLTDLYVQLPMHTPEEEQQFTELALRLLDEVDIASKIDMARRLAAYGAAPAAVVRRLAADATEVADAILSRPSAAKPAHNASPGGTAVGSPPPRGEGGEVVPSHQARLSGVGLGPHLGELFFAATAAERAKMLDDIAASASAADIAAPQDAAAAIARLEAAALQGRPHDFVRELERAVAISRRQAERIVNDASGEPLLVAAKTLGVPMDVLQRILLLVNPAIGTSVRRVFDLCALYEKMPTAAALPLVSAWQRQPAPRREPDSATPRTGDLSDARRGSAAARSDATPAAALPRRGQRAS